MTATADRADYPYTYLYLSFLPLFDFSFLFSIFSSTIIVSYLTLLHFIAF